MHRKFIAGITAASLLLTAIGAAPAAADRYKTERALAALLGLAVVGAIVHENRKDKDKTRRINTHRPKTVNTPPVYHPHPRPLPDRANRKLLPQRCLRSIDTHNGRARFFGQRCLNQHFRFAHRLPRACNYVFRTHRGDRRGYEARCLRDRGYRLARG
ncbi:MAG: hypothetical protein AAF307_07500 [Pseudomonadota bacterium]